jgi:hypothetical protein
MQLLKPSSNCQNFPFLIVKLIFLFKKKFLFTNTMFSESITLWESLSSFSILTWARFHQCYTSSLYACSSLMCKKRESSLQCRLALLGPTSAKSVLNTLVKLTPGLNFINVLCTAFTLIDPKSVKRHWWLNCIIYAFWI